MASVISGDANVSAAEFGYLDGVTSALQTQLDAKLPIAGGKILQIVRATDGTTRDTTSSTYVDASISVTITPQKSDSAVMLVWSGYGDSDNAGLKLQISDSSNNALSAAEEIFIFSNTGRVRTGFVLIGYSTPATTSATTYKGRFCSSSSGSNVRITNLTNTGQLYAIEVSA